MSEVLVIVSNQRRGVPQSARGYPGVAHANPRTISCQSGQNSAIRSRDLMIVGDHHEITEMGLQCSTPLLSPVPVLRSVVKLADRDERDSEEPILE